MQARTRFTWGLEWAYSGVVTDTHNFNYYSIDGVRVQDSDTFKEIKSCGQFLVNAGVNLGDHFTAAFYTGYTSVYEARKVIPYSLRFTYLPKGCDNAGWKVFLDAGSAYPLKGSFNNKQLLVAKAGTGYRIPLYKSFCFDSFIALQYVIDHPLEIRDKYTLMPVPPQDLKHSDRSTLGFVIGFALTL
jgi:hypothetical protein